MKVIIPIVVIAAIAVGIGMLRPKEQTGKQILDQRRAVLEVIFGGTDDPIRKAFPPFYSGGAADVLTFRKHVAGVTYVTASLIGDSQSKPNALGQYELMICVRKDAGWASDLISKLGHYTTEAVLAPNDTMDIGPALPRPTELTSFLFLPFSKIRVDGKDAAVMLCLGITADELEFIQDHDVEDLVEKLKERKIYPFTDPKRTSVLEE